MDMEEPAYERPMGDASIPINNKIRRTPPRRRPHEVRSATMPSQEPEASSNFDVIPKRHVDLTDDEYHDFNQMAEG